MLNRILHADVIDGLRQLPDGLFHTVVTSPPYWGLRDYGLQPRTWSDGSVCCYGLEPTATLFVSHTVEIFREVRRVLRDDGTLWLNLGDSYAMDSKWGGSSSNKNEPEQGYARPKERGGAGLPDGNQCLIPHRVALALQADGWFLRSTIIWAKRSPMPESISGVRWVPCRVKVATAPRGSRNDSVARNGKPMADHDGRDSARNVYGHCPGCPKCSANDGYVLRRGKWRPTTSHEYIFLFSKSERYFCDGDAVQEACSPNTNSKGTNRHHKNGTEGVERQNGSFQSAIGDRVETRNPRSVWTLSNEPFRGAHFATFPTAIPRRCIEAGTSKAGCCPSCGSCYAPVVESERVPTRPGEANQIDPTGMANRDPQRHVAITRVTGYRPTCGCNAGPAVPCRVLEPFLGSGTTAQVAKHLGRDWVGIEASAEYVKIAERRIATPIRDKKAKRPKLAVIPAQRLLFTEAS